MFATQRSALFEDAQRADVFARFFPRREIVANIRKAKRPKDCISNRMTENIGVRMTVEPVGVWNFNSTQNQRAAFGQLVDVISNA
jgi:hypothetical protein